MLYSNDHFFSQDFCVLQQTHECLIDSRKLGQCTFEGGACSKIVTPLGLFVHIKKGTSKISRHWEIIGDLYFKLNLFHGRNQFVSI